MYDGQKCALTSVFCSVPSIEKLTMSSLHFNLWASGQPLTFHELLQKMNQQSQERVTQQSLRDALTMLKNEVTIGAGGRMHMSGQD